VEAAPLGPDGIGRAKVEGFYPLEDEGACQANCT
jgi:hypothetical protein